MVTDNFVCGDDHALTPVKAKLGKNVELTLLRKLLPFPEYYEDILVVTTPLTEGTTPQIEVR